MVLTLSILPVPLQESALAHVELPTTVETVEAAIKKHKDFTTTMELNLHRIKAVIEAGESLISQSNIYSDRIKERVDTLANRLVATSDCPALTMRMYIKAVLQSFLNISGYV